MTKLGGGPVLINRPRKVICKIGAYEITVSSDNTLEQSDKFDAFCQDFKGMLMALLATVKSTQKSETSESEAVH